MSDQALAEVEGLTIAQAGDLLRAKRLSARELTQAVLDRIARTEPVVHAYVEVFDEDALTTADAADAELRVGRDRGPLHGIPLGVKDIFDMQGVPTRCGSKARDGCQPADADARVVAMLRAAGAVLIGKTVTQEFAAGVISAPARNPWDARRIPGGSSGGSGAAVAVGSCLGALGSDTGGSIRIPAAVNGVVGLKPTYGRVSTRGVYPLSWSLDTVGPLAKSVRDAALLLNAIAGHDPDAPITSANAAIDATNNLKGGVRGTRLGVARPYFFDRIQTGVRRAVEAAILAFADLGAEIIEVDWAEARIARAAAFVINRIESVAVHRTTLREAPELIGQELRLRFEAGSLFPATEYLRALRARTAVKRSIAALFARHDLDAMLAPTVPGTAPLADHLFLAYDDPPEEAVTAGYTRLTMPFNATGQPVLSVPCGFDDAGLPVGLQIAGKPFGEAELCRIGHAYEQAAGWFAQRPPV